MTTPAGPRISLNKLAEYAICSGAHRRRAIVSEEKHRSSFRVARYQRAREAALAAFSEGDPEASLLAAAEALERRPATGEWDAEDLRLSAEALRALRACLDQIRVDGLDASPGEPEPPDLLVGGVAIEVRPDVILRGSWRGHRVVGAVKFHFSKGTALGEESARNVATLLDQYAESLLLSEEESVSLSHCQIVDVFHDRVESAPRAVKFRRAALEAACEEVAMHWSRV